MRIIIETNGALTTCELYGCIPTASNPDIDPFRSYPFKEADRPSQVLALNAFRIIEEEYKKLIKDELRTEIQRSA